MQKKLGNLRVNLALSLAVVALVAVAAESVVIGNAKFTCTNSCDVTDNGDGSFNVKDSDGGRVKVEFLTQEDKLDP